MPSGAERGTRVHEHVDRVGLRRVVPGGDDPEALAHSDRPELPLRERDPVLVADPVDERRLERLDTALRERRRHRAARIGVFLEERRQPRAGPGLGFRAGLAEHGALGLGARVGVGDLDRERPALRELVAEILGVATLDHEGDALPGHASRLG
jgi:hypothetical protein